MEYKIEPINFGCSEYSPEEMRRLVEEMEKAISTECVKRFLADERTLEEVLKANGWRKASDVAREIFLEIDSFLKETVHIIDRAIDDAVRKENFASANIFSNQRSLVDTIIISLAEIQKKWAEGGEKNEI